MSRVSAVCPVHETSQMGNHIALYSSFLLKSINRRIREESVASCSLIGNAMMRMLIQFFMNCHRPSEPLPTRSLCRDLVGRCGLHTWMITTACGFRFSCYILPSVEWHLFLKTDFSPWVSHILICMLILLFRNQTGMSRSRL